MAKKLTTQERIAEDMMEADLQRNVEEAAEANRWLLRLLRTGVRSIMEVLKQTRGVTLTAINLYPMNGP